MDDKLSDFNVNVTYEKHEVKVTREVTCVNMANVYFVDKYTNDDGRKHMLLWDLETDTMAIGFGFYDFDKSGDYALFHGVDAEPNKRVAFQAWLNLTAED